MDDSQVHGTIEQLVAEEHELWELEAAGNASESDRQRLREVKVSLDQCWDLLRQRRALREAGRDPEAADVRRAGGGRALRAVAAIETKSAASRGALQSRAARRSSSTETASSVPNVGGMTLARGPAGRKIATDELG